MKKKMIVAGSSHSFGLGLELQHADRFNDVEYLKKHGVNLPIDHTEEDRKIWKKYRWATLLTNTLGLEQINTNEYSSTGENQDPYWFNGTVGNTLIKFLQVDSSYTHDIDRVFIQPSITRLEYCIDGANPIELTPSMMLNILEDKNSDKLLVDKVKNFIENYNEEERLIEFAFLFKTVVERHPHIKFHLILWYDSENDINRYRHHEEFVNYIEPYLIKFYTRKNKLCSPLHLLRNHLELTVYQKAFCYTDRFDEHGIARWDVNEYDYHASSEGNIEIYHQILRHIRQEDSSGNV